MVKRLMSWLLVITLICTCTPVSVNAAKKPKLNKTSVKIKVGKTVKLKLKNNKKKVKWSSANKKIATVNKTGLVKAKKKGKTRIIAKIRKKKYVCKVTVEAKKSTESEDKGTDSEEDPDYSDDDSDHEEEPTSTPASEESPKPGETEIPKKTKEPGTSSAPWVTEKPNDTSAPWETQAPWTTEEPEETPIPWETSVPWATEKPDETPAPWATEEPGYTPVPWETPAPWATEEPDVTPVPWETPVPWATEEPGYTPVPWQTPVPWVTATPTIKPTAKPTTAPTKAPTATPTIKPTVKPTTAPTKAPTATPTIKPTAKPTTAPTKAPTATPTIKPTAKPTTAPTKAPTATPTIKPTAKPTTAPTKAPTATPTIKPTAKPTPTPTKAPTAAPTATPTKAPTPTPTVTPTPTPDTGLPAGATVFTMGSKKLAIGMTEAAAKAVLGSGYRTGKSPQGFDTIAFHSSNYSEYLLIYLKDGKVAGIYGIGRSMSFGSVTAGQNGNNLGSGWLNSSDYKTTSGKIGAKKSAGAGTEMAYVFYDALGDNTIYSIQVYDTSKVAQAEDMIYGTTTNVSYDATVTASIATEMGHMLNAFRAYRSISVYQLHTGLAKCAQDYCNTITASKINSRSGDTLFNAMFACNVDPMEWGESCYYDAADAISFANSLIELDAFYTYLTNTKFCYVGIGMASYGKHTYVAVDYVDEL